MKGMLIAERNDTETKTVYIEQETLEFARQNMLTKKRRADNARKQKEADSKRSKAEKAEARRRAYDMATVKYMLTRFAFSGVMVAGWAAGLIHPLVSVPLILVSLCTACARCGLWIGKNSGRRHTNGR